MDIIKVATPGTVGPVIGGGTGGSGVGEPTPPAVLEGWRDKDPQNPAWPTGGGRDIIKIPMDGPPDAKIDGGWDAKDPWVGPVGPGWFGGWEDRTSEDKMPHEPTFCQEDWFGGSQLGDKVLFAGTKELSIEGDGIGGIIKPIAGGSGVSKPVTGDVNDDNDHFDAKDDKWVGPSIIEGDGIGIKSFRGGSFGCRPGFDEEYYGFLPGVDGRDGDYGFLPGTAPPLQQQGVTFI